MKVDHFHDIAFILYVLTCILYLCFVFWGFHTHPKRRAPAKHEFGRYLDLQIFYQDPIGD